MNWIPLFTRPPTVEILLDTVRYRTSGGVSTAVWNLLWLAIVGIRDNFLTKFCPDVKKRLSFMSCARSSAG